MFITKWLIALVKPLVSRCPRVATMYRSVRDQLDFVKEPIVTPWGFKLAGNVGMAQGTFEPAETELIRKTLKEVDVFVNVGANVGYYCCHALSMGKTVIAFEPNQQNLRYLCKNIKLNGWSDVEIYPIALSNSVDVLDIYGGSTGASLVKGWAGIPESYVNLVPSSTMDVVLGTRLKGRKVLVVVDIEGAEKWMLEGAIKMLANDPKPIWLVEITSKELQPTGVKINPNYKSTFQMFFDNGYHAFSVGETVRSITKEDVESVSEGSIDLHTNSFTVCEEN